MPLPQRASVYDQLRPHLFADDLIRRLGIEETRRIGSEVYCRPLCHESASGESLQVNLHTGRWNCKACQHAGVRGDLLQLVEYVLSGGRAPSHGSEQATSADHHRAVEWLCQQFGIPFDGARIAADPALDVVHMVAMAAHEHLLGAQAVLDWIAEKWGFGEDVVKAYGLGYLPSPLLPELVTESKRGGSRDAFRSSGIGWYDKQGNWHTRFAGRVVFPYLEHGRAVYLIGRATPWTPQLEGGKRPPKYHKLSVHSEQRPYISDRITNDHLYNEPVMSGADTVIVAEGVADAVALSSLGAPVVSPVTISFNATDLERFARKARESNTGRVEILFDNELSGSGNWAARRVGLKLVERGIVTRILTLPLGPEQLAARDEVVKVLGAERFAELERLDPAERKRLIAEAVPDEAARAWVVHQINASKIDAAEWCAQNGAGAAGRFDAIRRAGRDIIDLEIEGVAVPDDDTSDPHQRSALFSHAVELAAHIEDASSRGHYAGLIARAAGKGVTKADILQRIAHARRVTVKPKRESEREDDRREVAEAPPVSLVLLPPEASHSTPTAPEAPRPATGAPPAPPPPGAAKEPKNDHERYAPVRDAVARAVEEKMPIEQIGQYVAQTITVSMGYTPFRAPEELYLVRGSERIPTGLSHATARFSVLLFLASGLTPAKSAHRPYIAAVVYFLEAAARRVQDVSWSFVAGSGAVYFPMGDPGGRLLRIEPGEVTRTRMAEARVPAVAGSDFSPVDYVDTNGGIDAALDVFRWVSISPADRLVLLYWIVCLPVLRRIGTIPIVRIEGPSGSGKTRAIEAVSYLVNGGKGSSVPTAAALVSRMSTEMLTVDDNRESGDVTPAFLGTLLQATHLGAREKRKVNSDTGTVVERVCGALIMNGVEPIHDGRPELTSRMLVLRGHALHRAPDSPSADHLLTERLLAVRDGFWSEAVRRCAAALALDAVYGEHLGAEVEALFGATRIGRLSAYLRLMYLAWVAGLAPELQGAAVETIDATWQRAYASLGQGGLDSLMQEELAVSCLRYAFAYGSMCATAQPGAFSVATRTAWDGRYVETSDGESYLGPVRATTLTRIVREAGKHLNAPPAIATRLRAGQFEQRLLDGLAFLAEAGFEVLSEPTSRGVVRYTFRRTGENRARALGSPPPLPGKGDTWTP